MKFTTYYKKLDQDHLDFAFMPDKGLTVADVLGTAARAGFPVFMPVRSCEAASIDEVFYQNQGEVWVKSQAERELIQRLGVHSSMSVGDVAIAEDGRGWQCDLIGWIELPRE